MRYMWVFCRKFIRCPGDKAHVGKQIFCSIQRITGKFHSIEMMHAYTYMHERPEST